MKRDGEKKKNEFNQFDDAYDLFFLWLKFGKVNYLGQEIRVKTKKEKKKD